MRRLSRPTSSSLRAFHTSIRHLNENVPQRLKPELNLTPNQLATLSHKKLKQHPQAPLPTKGLGPFKRDAETGKRLSFQEREEEKAKEYLYEKPDLNQPLPPLLLKPPGLESPPGEGHGKETRKWWQREMEIWFGRYQKPFDVKAQVERHKAL